MPIVESLILSRGEDITLHMTMTPKKDITGWVISMTASKAANSPDKLFQVTGVITSGPNGKYDLILSGGVTGNTYLEPGTYFYDIFRVNPGNLRLLNEGDLIITPNAKYP